MSLDFLLRLPAIADRRLVLATDLDGTFLGGSDDDRRRLYDWIEDNRDSIGLIFVTGRDPGFIGELCRNGVPWPEYVVGDVGTTIARVTHDGLVSPMAPLETDIARRWNDAGDRVRNALQGAPGLTLQATDFRYRVSYNMAPDEFDPEAIRIVEDMKLDALISDDRYFDVLPRGVSKGPSLRRLVAHLGIAADKVLAAGDTLNDLSMLQCGLPAVAVGGAEAALLERVARLDHVHVAEAVGAAGILEAISHRKMHEPP